MARTKTAPPSRSLQELYGRPKTPLRNGSTQELYLTPSTPSFAYEQRWNKTHIEGREDANVSYERVQYGRWSKSGISWFPNRRSIPGDRPPPSGVTYSFRLEPVARQQRTPTPQSYQQSGISTPDSEPIVARPRRRVAFQLPESSPNSDGDAETISQEEETDSEWKREISISLSEQLSRLSAPDSKPIVTRPMRRIAFQPPDTPSPMDQKKHSGIVTRGAEFDDSSEDSEPVIVRRQRRPSARGFEADTPTPESSSESPETGQQSSGESLYITQQYHGPLSEEPSIATDLYDRVKTRARQCRAGRVRTQLESPRNTSTNQWHRRRPPTYPPNRQDQTSSISTSGQSPDRQDSTAEVSESTPEELDDDEEVLKRSLSSVSDESEYAEVEYGDGE